MSSQPLLVLNSLAQNTMMKVSIPDKAAKSPLVSYMDSYQAVFPLRCELVVTMP
jgi:hypothetical protein